MSAPYYSIRVLPLSQGVSGTKQTLREMASFVRRDANDLRLREQALKIVTDAGVRARDVDGEIRALFNFVRDKIRWVGDPVGYEMVSDAATTLHYKAEDCDGKSVLLASLLATLGYKSEFVVIGLDPGSENYEHVYLRAWNKYTNSWVSLDPTFQQNEMGQALTGPYTSAYPIFDEDNQENSFGVLFPGLAGWLDDLLNTVGRTVQQVGPTAVGLTQTLLAAQVQGTGQHGKITDGDIATALQPYIAAVRSGQGDPDAIWQAALPIANSPGGGAQTIAASNALRAAVEAEKSRRAAGSLVVAGNPPATTTTPSTTNATVASVTTDQTIFGLPLSTALLIGGGGLLAAMMLLRK